MEISMSPSVAGASAMPVARANPRRESKDESDVQEFQVVPTPEPLRMVRLNPAFARLVGRIPPSVLSVPSMMSVPEKRFLYGAANAYYTGAGVIIDAGIFLGASTRSFGEGIQNNPRRDAIVKRWKRPITSYERAIVNPGMPAFFARNKMTFTAEPGASFEDEIRRNIAPVQELVDLRIGDIMSASDPGVPIEILFLDVLKLPEISTFCFRTFFPRLIPGRSIVIQQDYFYERLPYIKTHQEMLGDYFEYVGEVGSTAIFQCTKEVPQSATDALEVEVSAAEQLRLASIALQRSVDPSRRFLMAISKLRLVRKLHGRDTARDYLDFLKGEYPEQVRNTRYNRLVEALAAAEKLCGGGTDDLV
jgi:hypothetical protein